MPNQARIVSPGPSDRTVRAADSQVLQPPADWELLPPGDATLTRRVKAAGLGLRGDRHPMAGDRGEHGGVLALLEDRRLAAGPVPGLGEFRQHPEFRDLAAERLGVATTLAAS